MQYSPYKSENTHDQIRQRHDHQLDMQPKNKLEINTLFVVATFFVPCCNTMLETNLDKITV